jgi:hypothetical protein
VTITNDYRFRWLLQHMRVERDAPSDWTCWLELDLIAYRSRTTSPTELLDALIERFPLREAAPTCAVCNGLIQPPACVSADPSRADCPHRGPA